jgi:two-component system phosphate regulon response regulator PhoB
MEGGVGNNLILVVDDDRKNLVIIKAFLTSDGFDVDLARNGEEALEKIADAPPDLILMDVFMPYMSGMELSETLKSRPETKDIPILAMSAYHEYASGAPRADLAADDFLKKPFSRENLLRKIRELIGGGPRD